jgi:hypothetical protein
MANGTDTTLTQSGIAADSKAVGDALNNIENIVGDTPVSVQLSLALDRMAEKQHVHNEYAMRDDVEELKKQIDMLIALVGDTSVANQISMAINKP